MNIPSYVTIYNDPKAGRSFLCNPCQVHCNSDTQITQHLTSKKHVDKVNGKTADSYNNDDSQTNLTPAALISWTAEQQANATTQEYYNYDPNRKSNLYCEVCRLNFSHEYVLKMHIAGQKHQRKVNAIDLLKSLLGSEPGLEIEPESGNGRCSFCDVTFYSPQHVSRHLTGEKHLANKNGRENGTGGQVSTISSTNANSAAKTPKTTRPQLTQNLPSFISKTEDRFLCNPCQSQCNSDVQLQQHLASKKHIDKLHLYCCVCNCLFTSYALLESHEAGAKHQRKLHASDLLKTLQQTESSFEMREGGVLLCSLCDVIVNSAKLLLAHIESEKHRSLKSKIGESVGANGALVDANNAVNKKPVTVVSQAQNANAVTACKKGSSPVTMNIPSYVSKLNDPAGIKKYRCNPCNTTSNSDMQLMQHIASKKHCDKLNGKDRPSSGSRGGSRSWRGTSSYTRGGRGNVSIRGGGGTGPQKWDSISPNPPPHNSSSSSYGHSFPDSMPSNYGDSYGLSSLGRSSGSDYGFSRAGGSTRGSSRGSFSRSDNYTRPEYSRGAAAYVRADIHSRSDYGADFAPNRPEELASYGRAADLAPQGYRAGQNIGHSSGRGIFTYTQPMSHNYVSGGAIL